MGNVVANYSFDSTLATMMEEKPVTADQVRTDINNAVNQGVAQMDQEDLIAMGKQAMANPALMKLQQVNPAIQQVRVKMENAPLTDEENAAIVTVVEDVFARRFPQ
jgi:DNA replication protein DnaD